MTTAYPGNVAVTDWQPQPLTDRRTALLRLAASRYDLPGCTVMAALTRLTPAIGTRRPWLARLLRLLRLLRRPDRRRRAWFEHFAATADNLALLDRVSSTDGARDALEEMCEGPWSGDVWAEALTRRDELAAEVDDMVREAQ